MNKNKKILVIEDDPSAMRLVGYTLEREGYQVLTAPNGLTGIRRARSEAPDLIVLDIMLPGMDGYEICHRLRAEPETARLPILMLSAKAQEIDRATGFKVGADDYLVKPAAPSEILSRVEALLARATAPLSKMVSFLGSKRRVGTTTIAVNVAIALSQKGKRVTVVDFCCSATNMTEQLGLGLRLEHSIADLLARPIDTISHRDLEAVLAVHHTGVRLLGIPKPSGDHEDISSSDLDLLLGKLQEAGDCILVDLPPQPSGLGKVVLTRCDLIIIVTDSKADSLPNIKSTASLLGLAGISKERIGAVIIDRDAIFNEVEFSRLQPTIELITGVSLLGIIPHDTRASLEPAPSSTPATISNPDSPLAWATRGMAQLITGEG